MRSDDTARSPQAQMRTLRTVGGIVIALVGCGYALLYPTIAVLGIPVGFIVALVGAGAVEPSMILGAFRSKDSSDA